MTLLTRHIEAGWHEVEWYGRKVAEKFHAQPGATSTVLREEADTQDELHAKLDLREAQLSNDEKIVAVHGGEKISPALHSALQTLGVATSPPKSPSSEDHEAALVEAEKGDSAPADAKDIPAVQTEATPEGVATDAAPVEGVLSDAERAKLRSDEEELEDGKVDGIEPPTDPGLVDSTGDTPGAADDSAT